MARIFILGSCASRDAFNLNHSGLSLVGYAARSSLASALTRRVFHKMNSAIGDYNIAIDSSFQRRMVEMDIKKTLRGRLRNDDYNILLLDFIDERFDVLELEGRVCTLSSDLGKTKAHRKLRGTKRLKPGDPTRHLMWINGLAEVCEIARSRQKLIAVNRVWFSVIDSSGAHYDADVVAKGNEHLNKLYDALPSDIISIGGPPDSYIGDPNHRWRRAPFHYEQAVYMRLLDGLRAIPLPNKDPSRSVPAI